MRAAQVPLVVAGYITWFLVDWYDNESGKIVTVSTESFLDKATTIHLKCIASGGCYYSPHKASADECSALSVDELEAIQVNATGTPRRCHWVPEGSFLPDEHSCFLYDPDPINGLSIAWKLGAGSSNFGVAVETPLVSNGEVTRLGP